jgi:hypothetical protein
VNATVNELPKRSNLKHNIASESSTMMKHII